MAPRVEIHPGDPRGLDRLVIDAIAVPLFEVRAQPSGVAGALDWRLCGRLGRLLRSGQFRGAEGEVVLMSALARVGAERVFLFGLGAPSKRGAEQRTLEVQRIVPVLADAGVRSVAIAPPETAGGPSPAEVVSGWLAARQWTSSPLERLVLLDAGGLERARDQLRAAASDLAWA